MIKKYLTHPGSIIVSGPSGLGKTDMAKRCIREIVDMELTYCTDFKEITLEGSCVSVEQIRFLGDYLRTYPVGELKYILFPNAEKMTEQAQNALLKEMEESRFTVFIFVTDEKMLSTVESRSIVVKIERPSVENYRELIRNEYGEINEALLLYSDRRKGIYSSALTNKDLKKALEDVYRTLHTMNTRREIMEVLYGVKEKDKNFFYEAFGREEVLGCLNLLKELFLSGTEAVRSLYTDQERYFAAYMIETHMSILEKRQYNKNDFFDLIRKLM